MTVYDPAAFDAFEQAGWTTKEAAGYDALVGRVTSRVAESLLDAVGAGRGTRLLDVATGPGYVASRAAARGGEPVGLDFSETMLAHARTQAADVEFVHGDATALPFADASFDAVVAAFLLLHLGTPERAVAEAARVLRQGGRAAFSVWDDPRGVAGSACSSRPHGCGGASAGGSTRRPELLPIRRRRRVHRTARRSRAHRRARGTVSFGLEFDDRAELWDGLVAGAVRLRPLILGQTEELQRQIRARYDELLEAYRTEDGFEVPVSVTLAAGTKA